MQVKNNMLMMATILESPILYRISNVGNSRFAVLVSWRHFHVWFWKSISHFYRYFIWNMSWGGITTGNRYGVWMRIPEEKNGWNLCIAVKHKICNACTVFRRFLEILVINCDWWQSWVVSLLSVLTKWQWKSLKHFYELFLSK